MIEKLNKNKIYMLYIPGTWSQEGLQNIRKAYADIGITISHIMSSESGTTVQFFEVDK